MRIMKTYLFQHALIAMLPKKGHVKRIFAYVVTSGFSTVLLANTATQYSYTNDTNRVVPTGADHKIIKSPANQNSQIAGNMENQEFSLPLVMTAFKVILNNNRVTLSWTTGIEKRLSHFVIERSTNGIDYKEAAIIFAVTNSSVKQNYSYTDPVSLHGTGMLYYRIKLVDPVGKFQNSAVKLIRIGGETSVTEVQAYPNPVVNEIRITVPSSWQNQQVKYEVYNASGRLVKRIVSSSANQTEVLNMQDCVAGMYLVRTSSSTESKSQCIFKK
jgi:type IX secretion system substrate protein